MFLLNMYLNKNWYKMLYIYVACRVDDSNQTVACDMKPIEVE